MAMSWWRIVPSRGLHSSAEAPALAILREEARRPTPRPMLLLYGNRVATQILARGELEGLPAAGRLKVVHVLGEPLPGLAGETGQLDTAVIARR